MGTRGDRNSDADGSWKASLHIPEPTANKLVAAVVAVLIGAGSVKLVTNEDIVRPDAWRRSDDAAAMDALRKQISEENRRIMGEIDRRMAPFERHLENAEKWKERIREVEANCRECRRRIRVIENNGVHTIE